MIILSECVSNLLGSGPGARIDAGTETSVRRLRIVEAVDLTTPSRRVRAALPVVFVQFVRENLRKRPRGRGQRKHQQNRDRAPPGYRPHPERCVLAVEV